MKEQLHLLFTNGYGDYYPDNDWSITKNELKVLLEGEPKYVWYVISIS